MGIYTSAPTGPSTSGPAAQKILTDLLDEVLADMHKNGAPPFVVSLARDAGFEFIDARRRTLPLHGESMADVLRSLSAKIFVEVDGGDAMAPWVLAAKTASLRFIAQHPSLAEQNLETDPPPLYKPAPTSAAFKPQSV